MNVFLPREETSPPPEGTENPRAVDLQGWVLVPRHQFKVVVWVTVSRLVTYVNVPPIEPTSV